MNKPTLFTFGFPDINSPRYCNLVDTYKSDGWGIQECVTMQKGFFKKHRDLYKKYKNLSALHNAPDAILVNFPGYYLMPLAWLLTRYPRKKLLFDAFVSVSDTLVSDRKLVSWLHPISWIYYLVDIISCHLADEVLIDTKAHKKFFASRFLLSPKKIRVIYVGTRKDLFFVAPKQDALSAHTYNVLFVGTYIPLQGIEYILHAAKILHEQKDIHFTLIGNGQTYEEMQNLAKTLQLSNVTFYDFMPLEALPKYLHSADIALGIFGTSSKANRVIPHKVFDAVACNIPVITAKNAAIEEQFTNGKEVFLCETGNAQSLADAILNLKKKQK